MENEQNIQSDTKKKQKMYEEKCVSKIAKYI